jgi:DNA-binding transcriptional LysR family regulator
MRAGLVRLDLPKLEVFLEATRCGSYTAAARRLHVTQSAVSHAIRKLEDAVGRPLVEWRRRRFMLTDEGQYVRQVCEQVFRDLGQAEHILSARATGGTQVITVGATVEFGTTVLVRKLRPLVDAAPWLHIDFRFRDDLAQMLLRDEIDVAIDCSPHVHPSVQATRLFREKYVMVASPAFLAGHPVQRPIDLERVAVLSLDKEGAWWANALRSIPGRRRPVLARVIEVNQVRGMVHAALEGYGVALLPKYTVRGKVERGDLVSLFPKLRLLEEWFCVYQKRANADREKNRLLTDFLLRLDVAEFGDALTAPRTASPRSAPGEATRDGNDGALPSTRRALGGNDGALPSILISAPLRKPRGIERIK